MCSTWQIIDFGHVRVLSIPTLNGLRAELGDYSEPTTIRSTSLPIATIIRTIASTLLIISRTTVEKDIPEPSSKLLIPPF